MSAMGLLLESTLKISIVVLIALAAAALSRRRSAALRHWILSAAIVCAAAMPLLTSVVPSWSVPVAGMSAPGWISGSDGAPVGNPAVRPASSREGPADVPPLHGGAGLRPSSAVTRPRRDLDCRGRDQRTDPVVGLGRLRWMASRARQVEGGRIGRRRLQEICRKYELRRPVRLLRSDHPGDAGYLGIPSPEDPAAPNRTPLERGPHPHRPLPRTGAHQAAGLADSDGRRDRAVHVLVQSARVDRLYGACDRKASTRPTMPCSIME